MNIEHHSCRKIVKAKSSLSPLFETIQESNTKEAIQDTHKTKPCLDGLYPSQCFPFSGYFCVLCKPDLIIACG